MSSTEANYIVATEAAKEYIWFNGLILELEHKNCMPVIFTDFQSALCLSKDHVYHERSKHIDVRYHFIRDMAESMNVVFRKIPGDENPAEFGTKIV